METGVVGVIVAGCVEDCEGGDWGGCYGCDGGEEEVEVPELEG